MKIPYALLLFLIPFFSCNTKESADLIIHHAHIYTVNNALEEAEAFAVKEGKILAVGTNTKILESYTAPHHLDMKGKTILPGLIDPHCHFHWFGKGLNEVNLFGTKSFAEVLERVKTFHQQNPEKKWIVGRGWDQNDWENKDFPVNDSLNHYFPTLPVSLHRIDGHALLVNQKCLDLAQITPKTTIKGGEISQSHGKLTGILKDNALVFVEKASPPLLPQEIEEQLLDAQQKCLAVGLTSIGEAGLDRKIIEAIDQAQAGKKLKMRIYAMISCDTSNLPYYLNKGFYQTDYLHVRSFKIYADGALGSRGACLLHPYHDKPQETGYLLQTPHHLDSIIGLIQAKGFQINAHCIGDSANRTLLHLYGKYIGSKKNLRWRIEHAQVVHPDDFGLFKKWGVIPSTQPTHATSDMYWAEARLGKSRLLSSYAYKRLLDSAGIIANGSDFPIEDINPLWGFHAAVARKDAKGFPENGFQKENALSRIEALKAMTIWAAFAQFEEHLKGSIEKGKWADFVVLEKDILTIPENEIRSTRVVETFINGVSVWKNPDTP